MPSDVTLREYIEMILSEREKHSQLALELASVEIERRLKDLNQLREDVVKDRGLFVKSDNYELKIKELDTWKTTVDKAIVRIDTKSTTWGAAIMIVVIIIQILVVYFK